MHINIHVMVGLMGCTSFQEEGVWNGDTGACNVGLLRDFDGAACV